MPLVRKQTFAGNSADAQASDLPLADLVDRLESAASEERRSAARAMGGHSHGSVNLGRRLAVENDASVRAVIFSSLARLADAAAVDVMIQCLRTGEATLRNEALQALRTMPDSAAALVADLLDDPDADMRIHAIVILEALRHPGLEGWLLQVLARDVSANVCGAALDVLSEIATPSAVEPLELAKQRFVSEPYIQFAADLALSRLASRRAAP